MLGQRPRAASDAERPEGHADAERRTIVGVALQMSIVPHAPRGNAVRDALRHISEPRCTLWIGR
ncbi:DUF1534 domain-containing protein [Pseudomonas syringae]|nr:DUF1534 domain-containing protein [Pseudomonas syringae]MCF5488261.1 DUF1534 domain-containing protein [Pseudomonas syringae]MCF5492424.1 DUF1534 domain-containing protein [Pseudomonas syringae]MCF5498724.1 DUF1534 domain-containing protein [Pseudomonas syringae]MCF5575993.1 DUF1534 domain-containing protein [Pseudomonas syringae]